MFLWKNYGKLSSDYLCYPFLSGAVKHVTVSGATSLGQLQQEVTCLVTVVIILGSMSPFFTRMELLFESLPLSSSQEVSVTFS